MPDTVDTIAELICDYRNDDGINITPQWVSTWARQFGQDDAAFMLEELLPIIQARYISKAGAQAFLGRVVRKLAADYAGGDLSRFLETTVFLSLQAERKSQSDWLELLDDLLLREHGARVQDCGRVNPTLYVYLDDVLCTGNTAFFDVKHWWESDENRAHSDAISGNRAQFVFVYWCIHSRQSHKLKARFKYEVPGFKYKLYRLIEVENEPESPNARLDLAYPRREIASARALAYYESLEDPDQYTFRPPGRPALEEFFTSPENRDRFERVLLDHGLDLMDRVVSPKSNMRPLGFTLPSHKNMGFGALCWTWRNVPNNTPLPFWYGASGWTPLFPKRSS